MFAFFWCGRQERIFKLCILIYCLNVASYTMVPTIPQYFPVYNVHISPTVQAAICCEKALIKGRIKGLQHLPTITNLTQFSSSLSRCNFSTCACGYLSDVHPNYTSPVKTAHRKSWFVTVHTILLHQTLKRKSFVPFSKSTCNRMNVNPEPSMYQKGILSRYFAK